MPQDVLQDMFDLIDIQPWIKNHSGELTDLWNICDTREEQLLLKTLISDFCMFDQQKEILACKKIDEKIQSWGLSYKNTWIVATANAGEVDGSTAGLQKLKNKIHPTDDWHLRTIGNIPAAVAKIKDGDTIVLFDDFIGSGKTMVRKKNWLNSLLEKEKIKEVKYYFLAFSGMKFGIDHIRLNTGCEVYSHISLQKAITEKYDVLEASHMTTTMRTIEAKLGVTYKRKKIAEYSLGYEESEALYCVQNDNCPNNVFPILWWPLLKDGTRLRTLLTRAG
ncbi:hypothetical protein O0882_22825 [Janthinobacterium sp. SUN073]|uniref:phosphoribosyltransferase-like protein n=1 Tax=Janthinobacterium sp. SUN073 TaxID=3004102 RepID=UPI0025B2284E|nr:hypothetical protein [Janthinobacterium sp. SUN073]MDN2699154.1 hypothetical protein [Janthinobacterium sp. SUN073]